MGPRIRIVKLLYGLGVGEGERALLLWEAKGHVHLTLGVAIKKGRAFICSLVAR